MDSRIYTLRLALLCAIGIASWAIWPSPEGPMVLFAAGIGLIKGCGCYCGGCSLCSGGTGSPRQWQIIVADLTDDATWGENCSTYNGTFVLDFVAQVSATSCRWSYTLTPPYCEGEAGHGPFDTFWLVVGDTGSIVGVVFYCNAAFTECDNNTWGGSAGPDCSAVSGASWTHSFGLASFCCQVPVPGSHTITVTAIP